MIYILVLCWLQNDLLQLFQPFGVITKLVMLRAKNQVFFMHLNETLCFPLVFRILGWVSYVIILFYLYNLSSFQALLQMQDIPSAVNALQFYANVQPSIRYKIYIYIYILKYLWYCLEYYFDSLILDIMFRDLESALYAHWFKIAFIISLSFCFILGVEMFMSSFPHIKN